MNETRRDGNELIQTVKVFRGDEEQGTMQKIQELNIGNSDKIFLEKLAGIAENIVIVYIYENIPERDLDMNAIDDDIYIPGDYYWVGVVRGHITIFETGSKSKIQALPDETFNLEFLETLIVDSFNIKTLPDSIEKLKKLVYFDINGSMFNFLPKSIRNLENLEVLRITNCDIAELPEAIGGLVKLRILDIRGNRIQKLPESIGNLSSLRELNLTETGISQLPESIGNLQNLQVLNLEFSNIDALPKSMANLKSLKKLTLDKEGQYQTMLEKSYEVIRSLLRNSCKIEKYKLENDDY